MTKSQLLLSALSLTTATAAMGQSTTTPPSPSQQSGMQQLSTEQLSTQYLMQNNGGSLLAAQQAQYNETASADSSNKNGSSFNLYAVASPEPHVLKKHDIVSIVVNEQSSSQTNGKSDQERAADFDAKVDAFVKFNLAKLSVEGDTSNANPSEIKMEGSRDFKATGEYDRSDSMTTRLGAEVVDVKPNGTLVIQAKRHLKIDEEELTVTLSGVCRVADVDASNSVLSTDLHDLNLEKITKGQVTDTNKRGLIHRLLDIINVF